MINPRLWTKGQRWGISTVAFALLAAALYFPLSQTFLSAYARQHKPVSVNIAHKPTPTPTTSTHTAQITHTNLPTAFPKYFSFGVMNSPTDINTLDQMRTQNGTAFSFRYQYLAGGVNTGHGWETWNQPAGQFATYYMQASDQHKYIPTFVYYEICQSSGPNGSTCGANQGAQDAGNLANATVMKAYYANWTLLMKAIGSFGKPALVIVEPDLWGFLESAGSGSTNAANLSASVKSSGNADTASYPNTVQGFSWALLHMRDKYAPNALLALHASTWATQTDIATDTRTSLNMQQLAQTEATFLKSAGIANNPAGVSSWDILSSDVADYDSAQPGGRSWWDRNNITFPNFTRYLTFIKALSQATGKRVVMWQVPEGNQYFKTMNNSTGHYQDNRAEYILNHVSDFAAAGIIAVLFGPGNGGTTITDAQHDGVTNGGTITGYECANCNTHVSTYPDDDGGYLRIFIGQYLKNPVQLS